MEKLKFDVCVIGCGPAGFAAAMRSYDFDNHVCIIEGNHVGGAGISDGALSSKTMWELAKDYSIAWRQSCPAYLYFKAGTNNKFSVSKEICS